MKLGYAVLMVAIGAVLMFAPAAMGAADKAEKGHAAKANAVMGEVTAIEVKTDVVVSITVVAKKKDAQAEPKTIAINADTKILIAVKGEGEKKAEPQAGTLADVKVGSRVVVTLNEKGDAATKILVLPAGGGDKGGKREKTPK